MNRKTIVCFAVVACVMMLAACVPAATVTSPSNGAIAPTALSTTASDTISPTATEVTAATEIVATGVDSPADSMDPNLACSGGKTSASVTPELTEGPYYKAGSPEQADLYQSGMPGTKLVITGYVYDTNCQPVANAWLDFWQADANGNYDNNGYTLRGHQTTDENGRFQLTTVVPGLYAGRTEHIHFKVQSPNGQILTSQLFFPGVVQNDSDGIFNEALLLSIQQSNDSWQGQYNVVVPAA